MCLCGCSSCGFDAAAMDPLSHMMLSSAAFAKVRPITIIYRVRHDTKSLFVCLRTNPLTHVWCASSVDCCVELPVRHTYVLIHIRNGYAYAYV